MSAVRPAQGRTAPGRQKVLDAMLEKDFQTGVLKLARFHGFALAYHTHDSRRSAPGFPDLVLVNPPTGRVLWRELKTNKGRVSPEQRAWLDGLTAAGMDAGVWRPNDLDTGLVVAELRGETFTQQTSCQASNDA